MTRGQPAPAGPASKLGPSEGPVRERQSVTNDFALLAGRKRPCERGVCERRRATPGGEFSSPGGYGASRSGARRRSSGTGRPTTFQKSPSIDSTSAAPRPWIA